MWQERNVRMSSRPPPNITSVQVLNNLIKSRNAVDIWRIQHPTDRDYSFYSHVHKSYSRIDYFLIDSRQIPSVTNTKYHNILISDHSPLSMSLNLSLPKQNYSWCFNPLLVSDGNFVEATTTKLKTLKVVFHGDIISFESAIKKEREKHLSEIRNTLPTYEATYRTSLSSEDYNKIVKLKYDYNCTLGGQTNSLLLKLRQKHFELGEKPVGLMSRQLRSVQASRTIHNIKSEAGTLLTDPIEINDRFKEFYSKLYSSKRDATHSDLANFFDSLETPKLSDAAREDIDSDFTLEEIISAIKSFPSGKACGPDGFSCEFYKKFGGILAPLLLRMMVSSKRDKILPKRFMRPISPLF